MLTGDLWSGALDCNDAGAVYHPRLIVGEASISGYVDNEPILGNVHPECDGKHPSVGANSRSNNSSSLITYYHLYVRKGANAHVQEVDLNRISRCDSLSHHGHYEGSDYDS